MKTLEEQLSQYAAYHRDSRNIGTHFIGVPMIVVAVTILLSRPSFDAGAFTLSPALVAALAAAIFYLRLDLKLGALMAVLLGMCLAAGAWAASLSTVAWVSTGVGLFVMGWLIQFIGHAWEGRKPAFVDDLVGLIIGPLFVTAEALFAFGMMPKLKHEVERRAGPVRPGGKVVQG